jgi:phosphocarrier protein FPr
MVSLVIVSHSAILAEGVRELANQMAQGKVAIAAAGGIDDPENPIGTDPMKVMAAVESVYDDDGVVVLMDLGSALMSAEMALEFLTPEQQANVFLCAAPLVEGAVSAAVTAMSGGTAQQVMAEAQTALEAKLAQLAPVIGDPVAATVDESEPLADAVELTLIVPNKLGLHARPAAKLVAIANRYSAEITITKDTKRVNAKSINQVALLGARQGEAIVIRAAGDSAEAMLAEIQALAEDNFGDRDDELPVATESSVKVVPGGENGVVYGLPASDGIAIGPFMRYEPVIPEIEEHCVESAAVEWQRLLQAITTAVAELEEVKLEASRRVGSAESAIFEAHQLILTDPDLDGKAKQILENDCINAEAAWYRAFSATADAYRDLPDPYMQARAVDVHDAGIRVLRHLMGVKLPTLTFEQPTILVARELSPSDTARMEPGHVLGIITEIGGATSHSAILARALGIPAIVGASGVLDKLITEQAETIAIDGGSGQVWLVPDAETLDQLQTRQDTWLAEQQAAKVAGQGPAITTDGVQFEIAANIGSPHDVPVALSFGAEGVGLFRTEFLFMDRDEAPTEDEQVAAYAAAAEALDGRPLIIRTLDVGGDKPISYLNIGQEDNPFLGWRAIRYCLDNTDLFMTQLRAICRVGATHNVKVMFPMIATYAELHRAKALLGLAMSELDHEGMPVNYEMEAGIMIEVPSAVQVADQLAGIADFFSIGTNDLTQYLLAADRGNPKVADLANALQPAVLRAIKQTVDVGHAHGIWVGMCGELAGNPLATPVLVGLGLDELSMSGPAIPAVKQVIRDIDTTQSRDIAAAVLKMDSADAITYYLKNRKHIPAKA